MICINITGVLSQISGSSVIKVLAKSQNFLEFLISKSLLKSVFVYQTNCFLENYSEFS